MPNDLLTSGESKNENLSSMQQHIEPGSVREQKPFEFVVVVFANHLKEWFALIKENKNVEVKRKSNYKK